MPRSVGRRRAACRRPRGRRRGARAWRAGCGRRSERGSSARRARPTRAGSPVAVADQAGRRRRPGVIEVGEQLGPHRHDACGRGEARNSLRLECHRGLLRVGSVAAERPEEARVLAGVAGALALLLDDEQQGVAVAVVVAPRARTGGRRRCRPCATPPGGSGSRRPCAPRRGCRARVSSFIHAIISTCRCSSSCTMAGTSPSAL